MSPVHPYGDKPHWFVPSPKPANWEAPCAAWNDDDQFAIETAKYMDQARRAGATGTHLTRRNT